MSIVDKHKRGRLRAVFALSVSMNLPTAVVRLLAALPLRKLYKFCDRLWKGYYLRFRIYPYKQNVGSLIRDVVGLPQGQILLTGSYPVVFRFCHKNEGGATAFVQRLDCSREQPVLS